MIEVEGLTKLYGELKAIDDISFRVEEGEIVGLLGPNGAGKSTTMKILTCYMPSTYGRASVAGHDIFEEPLEVKRQIGYLPEVPPIYPEMTVEPYLHYVSELKGVPSRERRAKVSQVMEETGLAHVRHRLIGHLSRGYQQRVGLAQALVHNPKILILDEPTVGLDPNQIIEIRELIKSLGRDRTVILSTHILPEVHMTCEKIIVIHQGRIVGYGTEEELSHKVLGSDALQLTVKGPGSEISEALEDVPGVASVHVAPGEAPGDQTAKDGLCSIGVVVEAGQDVREEVFHVLAKKGWPIYEMRPPEVSLEQVFIKLTTGEDRIRTSPAVPGAPKDPSAGSRGSQASEADGTGKEASGAPEGTPQDVDVETSPELQQEA